MKLKIFFQRNAFENVVCKMRAILFRPQCVNTRCKQQSRKNSWDLSGHFEWRHRVKKCTKSSTAGENIWRKHYGDVIMTAMTSQITGVSIVCSIESSVSLTFVKESTGDHWIPFTNGQLRGKCFHLIMSSWHVSLYRQHRVCWWLNIMMTSSNGNIFSVTGHLCGEFTGRRWIPRTKASDAEVWCFLWSE